MKFIAENMLHSCGPWTVEEFLKMKGPRAQRLYGQFIYMARLCGPLYVAPLKTRVTLLVRVRFAAIQRVSEKGMTVSFWLNRKIENNRFQRVDFQPPNKWLYTVRIYSKDELDNEVQAWLCEAYKFGKHNA